MGFEIGERVIFVADTGDFPSFEGQKGIVIGHDLNFVEVVLENTDLHDRSSRTTGERCCSFFEHDLTPDTYVIDEEYLPT